MCIHIVIHALPHEIDQLENLLIQLKRNSVHLPKDHGIHVAVELNCKLVDWENSSIPQSYFFNKFHQLKRLTFSWASVWFMGDQFNGDKYHHGHRTTSLGCNDARRRAAKFTNGTHLMYLDVDNVFGDFFLYQMWNACKLLGGEGYHVITPQTTRMWDSTWDVITNLHHIEEEASHSKYDIRDPYESILSFYSIHDRKLRAIKEFKFAGWGTTISASLLRLIGGIPKELGSYGLDDTYIMQACYIAREKGHQITQYVIENEIIIENNLFRFNPYKDYLKTIDKREEFLAQAHANFPIEIQKLYERL